MKNKCCIILAAGEGKRMKSDKPKVLSEVLFKPMLKWVIDAALASNIDDICVVSGYKHEIVEDYINKMNIKCDNVIQHERKGTAHAVIMAKDFLNKHKGGDVLILGGDAPFIDPDTINMAYKQHIEEKNSVTVISANLSDPFGYGRIVRDSNLKLSKIIEQKDADESIRSIKEVNSGAYWFNIDALVSVLSNVKNNNAQGEYYLPDTIKLLLNEGCNVNACVSNNFEIVLGANDSNQLHSLNKIARDNIIKKFISAGVSIPCDDSIIIGCDVKISKGTTILPSTIIMGDSSIGANCVLGPNTQIINSTVDDNTRINSSVCVNSMISSNKNIGPFKVLKDVKN